MAEKPTYEELEQKVKELEREFAKHKAAGSEAERQKGLYEAILDGILNGVWVSDNEDVIYYTNKGMEIIAGIPADQILGAQVLKDFPERTLEFFRPHYLKAKETLQPVYYDAVPVTTPANRQSYQSGWLIPRMKDDNFDGMICTLEDATDRKNAEDALRKAHDKLERKVEERTEELSKSNEQLKGEIEERKQAEETLRESARLNEMLLDSLPHPAMLIDRHRTVIVANKIALEVGTQIGGYCWQTFGHSLSIPEEHKRYIAEHDGDIPPSGTKCTFCLADQSLKEQAPFNTEVTVEGTIYDTWWLYVDGDIFLHYSFDITERKRVEDELM